MLYRNPSRHLPESFAVRIGAGTPAYDCSFPGRVDTIEALLRLLLRLRTIRDLHKEHQRALHDRLRPLHQRARRWTIDYDHCINVLDAGRSTTTTASTCSTLDARLRPVHRRALRWTRLLQLFFRCSARLVVTICDHLLAWLSGLRGRIFVLLLS